MLLFVFGIKLHFCRTHHLHDKKRYKVLNIARIFSYYKNIFKGSSTMPTVCISLLTKVYSFLRFLLWDPQKTWIRICRCATAEKLSCDCEKFLFFRATAANDGCSSNERGIKRVFLHVSCKMPMKAWGSFCMCCKKTSYCNCPLNWPDIHK